ncbi:MAG: DEAD/DEAH box helicase [Planctomycetota bacterium]|nr:DEAD/DEAH box helicase [Planctomycetota bacterium]
MKLRDYQRDAVEKTLESFRTNQAVLLVLATGTGKTVIAGHIADHFKDHGRILLLAHREELVFQGLEKLERITGAASEIEMADSWAGKSTMWGGAKIIVSTIQTQIAGRDGGRMNRFDPNDFALVIIDEAHHATAKSYRKVNDYYRQNPNVRILGLTATPDRADEEALGQVFDDVAFEYEIRDGIDNGWLVPVAQQSVHVSGLDYSSIRTTAGDLNGKDLAEVLEFEGTLHGMTTPILDLCGNAKTLIFTATVAQAERMAEILNRHKPDSAEFVCGTTPKEYRRELFRRYAAGGFQYLANVGVATEGFDEPGIQHIVMARPTKSRALFAQMLGRGTRTLPGVVDDVDTADARKALISLSDKPLLNVLDFVGNAGRHKLIHPTDILGGKYTDEVVELANRNIERTDKPADIASELVKAEREIERRRRMREEAALRAKIRLTSKYSTSRVNPFDVLDIVPCREPGWHKGKPATDRQKAALVKFGVNVPENLSFVHASQLLGRLVERAEEGRPSFKMSKILRSKGYDPDDFTFHSANELIGRLAANGWRRV